MKKFLSFMMFSLLSLLLVSCGQSPSSSQVPASSGSVAASSPAASSMPNLELEQSVTIGDCEVLKTEDGEDAVKIYLTFKNNSSEPTNYLSVFIGTLYQNGVECTLVSIDDDNDTMYTKVKDGGEVAVMVGYLLQNTTDPVELDIVHMIDGEAVASKTFDL